jgi:hypothetical protein
VAGGRCLPVVVLVRLSGFCGWWPRGRRPAGGQCVGDPALAPTPDALPRRINPGRWRRRRARPRCHARDGGGVAPDASADHRDAGCAFLLPLVPPPPPQSPTAAAGGGTGVSRALDLGLSSLVTLPSTHLGDAPAMALRLCLELNASASDTWADRSRSWAGVGGGGGGAECWTGSGPRTGLGTSPGTGSGKKTCFLGLATAARKPGPVSFGGPEVRAALRLCLTVSRTSDGADLLRGAGLVTQLAALAGGLSNAPHYVAAPHPRLQNRQRQQEWQWQGRGGGGGRGTSGGSSMWLDP